MQNKKALLHTSLLEKDYVSACVPKNNPLGARGTCVYKGPTLRGSDAQIEDQSYEHTMHVQSSNPMGRCM